MVQSFLPYITFLNSKLERIHLCSLSDLGQLMFSAVNPLAETHGSQKLSVIPTPYASRLLCFCHLTLFTLILFSLLCFVIPPCVLIFRGPMFHGYITVLQKMALSFSTTYIHWTFSVSLGNTCYLESTAD